MKLNISNTALDPLFRTARSHNDFAGVCRVE
jgi:hypothetical protein